MWDFVNLEVEFQSLFYILERHLGDLEVVSNCLGVCGERVFILSADVLVVLTSVVFSTVFRNKKQIAVHVTHKQTMA